MTIKRNRNTVSVAAKLEIDRAIVARRLGGDRAADAPLHPPTSPFNAHPASHVAAPGGTKVNI